MAKLEHFTLREWEYESWLEFADLLRVLEYLRYLKYALKVPTLSYQSSQIGKVNYFTYLRVKIQFSFLR